MPRLVSLVILTVVIVFLGITFYKVIAPFLLPLFLAGIMAALCQPIQKWFVQRTGGRVRLSAGLTTAAILLGLLLPFVIGTLVASIQLYTLADETMEGRDWQQTVENLRERFAIEAIVKEIQPYLPARVDAEQLVTQSRENIREGLKAVSAQSLGVAATTLGALGGIFSGLLSVAMFVIALYYFLADGPALLAAAESLIPVHANYQREILDQFNKVVRAVVIATFVAAISQGLLTAIAIWLVGWAVDSEFLRGMFLIFFVLAALSSVIPVAGTWLVWGPVAVGLAIEGHWASCILLTAFGAGVIGTMDNVVRTYVLHTDAKLHPLLAFVSVLGGLKFMGLWGVFIGPIVASCLYALVLIFNKELQEFSREQRARKKELGEGDVPTPRALGMVETTETETAPEATLPTIGRSSDAPAVKEPKPKAGTSQTSAKPQKSRRRRRSRGRK
ncbi:MAG: AI-2E family transporter [Planctomycetaceae bacterium]